MVSGHVSMEMGGGGVYQVTESVQAKVTRETPNAAVIRVISAIVMSYRDKHYPLNQKGMGISDRIDWIYSPTIG
jgi:hypothetical protein